MLNLIYVQPVLIVVIVEIRYSKSMNNAAIDNLKQEALYTIDRNRDEIVKIGKSIFNEPEEGYREYKTAQKVKEEFEKLSIPCTGGYAITGIKGTIRCGSKGPRVALLGELDAIINPEHPKADRKTGAAHACGHFAQIAWLLGGAIGLKAVADSLTGSIALLAVPAEEFINMGFREDLRKRGEIQYFGGKQEFIRLGLLDDIDIAIMNHAHSGEPVRSTHLIEGYNGFIGKSATFTGRASHAGAAPHLGINALSMFHVALSAINAQRETFKDTDASRVHFIITKGGDSVNVVPSEVKVEMFVRANRIETIQKLSRKIDNALKAGALGIGGSVEIRNIPGYMPLIPNKSLYSLWRRNADNILGSENVISIPSIAASTDMGDISHIIPSIEPSTGGFIGDLHSKDFTVVDEEMAYIIPAKLYAMTVIDLLKNGAGEAEEIIKNYNAPLIKKQYLNTLNSMFYTEKFSPDNCK